jgi:DNA polymerase-2
MALSLKCFLLNHSSRDNHGQYEFTLYAVTCDGRPVKILIDNFRPLFFIPHSSIVPQNCRINERKPLSLLTLDGIAVDCLYFNSFSSALDAAKLLRTNGIPVYESDVHHIDRYLMERFVTGGFEANGNIIADKNSGIFLKNPIIRGCDMTPVLKVLSLDIETNADTNELYSIATAGKTEKVFIIGDGNSTEMIVFCKDEKELLQKFFNHISHEDPDVIIGWNVIDFDLRILFERSKHHRTPFSIGRDQHTVITVNQLNQTIARIPGRVVMDVPMMLRAYYHSFEEYSLKFVAEKMLNKSKSITLDSKAKIAEINRLFNYDKPALCEYNLQDARLTKEIFDKAGILPNTIERSKRSGLLPDRTGGSIAAFDYLYLPRLHRKGYIAPDVADVAPPTAALPGGLVIEPSPGIYDNVLVFDFRSLYPSIITTFKIDPLGLAAPDKKRIKGPVGPSFSSENHILPGIIDELLEARSQAKKSKNSYLSQSIKILMNSFYGVLGTNSCRFFSSELSTTITKTGQYILKSTIEFISANTPYQVIYGDTDSIFVLLGPQKENEAESIGNSIAAKITTWLTDILKKNFDVDSALRLQYEQHFRYFFVPSVRGAAYGSKKHYCGVIEDNGDLKLIFKGMESARTDWTDLAKEFQQELYHRIFSNSPYDDLIINSVSALKRGELDDKLIYKKRLRKQLEEYTMNIPPHVQAAKLLDSPHHLIKYFITIDGPQPVEKRTSPIDYQHYIDAQLRPVANSILEIKGTSFDAILSGQTDLFE